MQSPLNTQSGFTLLELMLAFTVLTLALLGATGIVKNSADNLLKTEQSQQAVELAYGHLAELSLNEKLDSGLYSGRYVNGFDWRLSIEPVQRNASRSRSKIEALKIDLLVSYPKGQRRFHDVFLRKSGEAKIQPQ